MGKRRRGPAFQPATKAVGGPLAAIAVQRAQRNGKQDAALQLAKDGAPKDEIKDAIWEIAMTPSKRIALQKSLGAGYADLDGAIDDLAENLIKQYTPKDPDDDPVKDSDE